MYPTLYHAFFDLFGIEILFLKAIPMFGFWVAMGFISGSYLYTIELQRKESENVIFSTSKKMLIGLPPSPIELLLNGLMGFVLGGKLLYLIQDTSVFNDFPHFILSSKVSLLGGLIGALVFGYWKYWETSKNKLSEPIEQEIEVKPHHHVSNLTMIAVIGGILGAKLFAYLESPGPIIEFLTNFETGLTIYGGLIVASAGCIYYMWKNNLNILHFLDAVAPGLMLAYGVGRLGCQLSGDGDWGIVNHSAKPNWLSFLPDWAWAYKYPNNVNGYMTYQDNYTVPMSNCPYEEKYCYELVEAVYPTPLYEFIMCGILFLVLWKLRTKMPFVGMLFALYIALNGMERLLIEQIRINEKYHFGNFAITQAELIATCFILFGSGWMFWIYKKAKKREIINE